MDSFSKDTLFNDLPQSIKQKIINIRSLGVYKPGVCLEPMVEFEHVPMPSSTALFDTFIKMARAFEHLDNFDATDSLRQEIAEFIEFVNIYKAQTNNVDFISELEKTIGVMEDKFNKICAELGI